MTCNSGVWDLKSASALCALQTYNHFIQCKIIRTVAKNKGLTKFLLPIRSNFTGCQKSVDDSGGFLRRNRHHVFKKRKVCGPSSKVTMGANEEKEELLVNDTSGSVNLPAADKTREKKFGLNT